MKSIIILLTDPDSINQNLIIKSLNYLKKSKIKKIYFIGDKFEFNKIYDLVNLKKKFIFENIEIKKKNYFEYLKKITQKAKNISIKEKIYFIINMPLNKKKFLKNKYLGYTEFFSKAIDNKKNENMLLYNKNFSVCPLTTHMEIKNVDKEISQKKLTNAINNIVFFYKNIIKKKIKIIVLGLNPHASKDYSRPSKDKTCIKPVVIKFSKKIQILGPVSADTAFYKLQNKVFIGMYHDQVLIPFKMKNKFEGINITIGKKIIRLSPDHGTSPSLKNNIKKINNRSFIECIKFCEKINA